VNHAQVTGLLKAGDKVCGVQVKDEFTGREIEVRARVVAGAVGPWGDTLLKMDRPDNPPQLRPTKGVHLIVLRERVGNRNALSYVVKRDGRMMFVIPWGKFSIIGTTDTDYSGRPEDSAVEANDVEYVLEAFNQAFPEVKLGQEDIISAYAGVRPLVAESATTESKVSREHRIFTPPSGLIAIAGGKLTTYRVMAKQVVDLAEKRLATEFGVRAKRGCVTGKLPLEGAAPGLHAQIAREMAAATDLLNMDSDTADYLLTAYGTGYSRILNLIKRDPPLGEPIVPGLPYRWAEVPHAIQHEMALTLCDFLIRRTHIIYEEPHQGLDIAPEVARRMGAILGWSPEEEVRQLAAYRREVELTRRYKVGQI